MERNISSCVMRTAVIAVVFGQSHTEGLGSSTASKWSCDDGEDDGEEYTQRRLL